MAGMKLGLGLGLSSGRRSGLGVGATTSFVRSSSQGTGDGSSFANAAAYTSLPTLVANAAPGAVIKLLNTDTYAATPITLIQSGGAVGNPVTIAFSDASGVLETPASGKGFVGTRTSWTKPGTETATSVTGWTVGENVFSVSCSNLIFRNMNFERVQNCFDLGVSAAVSNIQILNCTFYNIRRFQDHNSANSATAQAINGLTIDTLTGTGFSKQCLRARGVGANAATNVNYLNVKLDSGWQKGDAFAVGIGIADNANNLYIAGTSGDYGYIKNIYDDGAGFWNGDCISTELGNSTVHIEYMTLLSATDGGLDSKATGLRVNNVRFGDCRAALKVWGGDQIATDVELTYQAPFKRGGSGQECIIDMAGTNTRLHLIGSAGQLNVRKATANSVFWENPWQLLGAVNCDILQSEMNTIPGASRLITETSTAVGGPIVSSSTALTAYEGITKAVTPTVDRLYWIDSVSGTDASLVTLSTVYGTTFGIAVPAYNGAGSNSYSWSVVLKDARGQSTTVSYTMTVLQNTTGYQTETLGLLDAMTVAPDTARKNAIDAFVSSLKTNGIWTKLDYLYLFAAHDQQAARLNWKNPALGALTENGTPTWTTDRGYTGTGVSGCYLDTGVQWTSLVKYTQNDNCIFSYERTNITGAASFTIGSSGSSARNRLCPRDNGFMNVRDSSGTGAAYTLGVATSIGLSAAQRTGASASEGFKDGTSIGTASAASAAIPTSSSIVFLRDASFYSARAISMAGVGGSLTSTQQGQLKTAHDTFKAVLGY